MSKRAKQIYEFGAFRLDGTERVLLCEEKPVALTPKALEVLLLLVERHGHIVEKDELMRRVWAESFVEEGNLKVTVSMLRKVLADGANGRQYIETVPRRGYRFVAPVREVRDEAAEAWAPAPADLQIAADGRLAAVPSGPAEAQTAPTHKRARHLRWAVLTACLVVGLALAGYFIWAKRTDHAVASETGERTSIAVLPFKTL